MNPPLPESTADKLLQQHTRLLEHQLDGLALRFRKAADARSVRELLGAQVRLVPEHLNRLASDTRQWRGRYR